MSQSPVRVAIVGLGRIASLLEDDPKREKPCTHAGAIVANPDCQLVGGCDPDPERRSRFRERWNCEATFETLDELIVRTEPEILHIATHPPLHRAQVELAVARGVKVIVCEKPLAHTLADARAIARLHRSGRATIICNHERRYAANYQAARELSTGGSLGPLVAVQAQLAMGEKKPLIGVLWHDGTHLADSLQFLTGGALRHDRTVGELRRSGGVAWLHGRIIQQNETKVPVLWQIDGARDHLVFEIRLIHRQGEIRIGNGIYEVFQSGASDYAAGFRSLHRQAHGFGEPTAYFANMVVDAVACFRNPGRQPASSANEALAVIEYLRSLGRWG